MEYRQQRFGDALKVALWATENCSNHRALRRLGEGRRLRAKTRYLGYQRVECPYVVPISDYRLPNRRPVLDESVGAFCFRFEQEGQTFEAIYVSSYYEDDDKGIVAIVVLMTDRLEAPGCL